MGWNRGSVSSQARLFCAWFLLVQFLASLAGCGTLEVGIESDLASAPPEAVQMTLVASPTPKSNATASATEPMGTHLSAESNRPTRTPYALPVIRTLFFLTTDPIASESGTIWQFVPRSSKVVSVTEPGDDVTAFDVWLGDGRLAWGTKKGELYLALPGELPRLLHNAGSQRDPVSIVSLAWSPGGDRLAFSTRADDSSPTGQVDGLWLLDLDDASVVLLVRNRHFDRDTGDVNEVRFISEPIWSPRGEALLLVVSYWEWRDILLLDPIRSDSGEQNLSDPSHELWTDAAWTLDGESILLSGANYAMFSDLVHVDRGGAEAMRLLTGEAVGLYVGEVDVLPEGIAFLAAKRDGENDPNLYLGRMKEGSFTYEQVGRRGLCGSSYVEDIQWAPEGDLAAVACGQGIQIIALDGSMQFDLGPFLGSLAESGSLEVRWGMVN